MHETGSLVGGVENTIEVLEIITILCTFDNSEKGAQVEPLSVRTTHELSSGSVPTQDKLKRSEERSLKSEPVLSTAVFLREQTWFVSGYLLSLYTISGTRKEIRR